jgi:prefoldin subunit 5
MELSTTKEELLRLSEEKKLLNEEIVKLMKDNEGIDSYKSKIDELERELQKVGGKYEHTLIILGEKSERVDELSADVDDLKDLLKLQVQQMIEMQSK